MISNLIFLVCLLITAYVFSRRVIVVRKNILRGNRDSLSGKPKERWMRVLKFAFAQGKMTRFRWAGILHLLVYVGFIVINIELLEILIDGVFGTHRIFLSLFGPVYPILIYTFEVLAFLVIIACIIFLLRRNIFRVKRLSSSELSGFPKIDANIILAVEIILMSAFLCMNAADGALSKKGVLPFSETSFSSASFISEWLLGFWMSGWSNEVLVFIERLGWWTHILGIFAFLIYIPYSKHFHIILAFPNTYFASLDTQGQLGSSKEVAAVVESFLNPSNDSVESKEPSRFGARDATDLSMQNLLSAYSCTECGRCTASCPASQTGKALSPRKIMMDTRDRIEEIGRAKKDWDKKTLLYDYIKPEEIMACTTCQACIEACPVLINPLDIIVKLRWHHIMDESKPPSEWVTMFSNIENNGAPWQFSKSDRGNWKNSLS